MATVTIDADALNAALADILTPWLKRVGRQTDALATAAAHVKVQKQTGEYKDGIGSEVVQSSTGIGVACRVVALAEHSAVIEDGSRAHTITAKNPSGRLKFRMNVLVNAQGQITGGTWVSPQSVNHPGTKPQRILQDALLEALELNGATVFDRSKIVRN